MVFRRVEIKVRGSGELRKDLGLRVGSSRLGLGSRAFRVQSSWPLTNLYAYLVAP